jgi:hypothetical protein
MFQSEHNVVSNRNIVEISENSENHLKAIVAWRQAAEGDGVGRVPKYRHEKRGGEGKALKIGARGWQS